MDKAETWPIHKMRFARGDMVQVRNSGFYREVIGIRFDTSIHDKNNWWYALRIQGPGNGAYITEKYSTDIQPVPVRLQGVEFQQDGRYPTTVGNRHRSRILNWRTLRQDAERDLNMYQHRVDTCRQQFDRCDAMRIENNPEWRNCIQTAWDYYRQRMSRGTRTCISVLNQLIRDNLRFYEHDPHDDIDKYHQRCGIIDSPGGLKDRFDEIWRSHQNLYTRLVEWDRQGWIDQGLFPFQRHALEPPPEPNWEPQPGNTQTRLYL